VRQGRGQLRHSVRLADGGTDAEVPDGSLGIFATLSKVPASPVSGDKDLHRLGQYGNARVVKVADMLNIIQGKGWRSPGG
jgi:hypothetical protein